MVFLTPAGSSGPSNLSFPCLTTKCPSLLFASPLLLITSLLRLSQSDPCRFEPWWSLACTAATVPMSNLLNPIQLLELSIISAQDLTPVTRSMHTYAIAWVHPDRRLSTRVDNSGRSNPAWDDKFVFRVDDEFLESDTSAITIEIYAVHWLKHVKVGTVRVLIDNLIPPHAAPGASRFSRYRQRQQPYVGMEFAALQVRRPSGRPQGMLNVGVAVLDSSMRSMPLGSSVMDFKGLLDSPGHRSHIHKQKKQTLEAAREAEFRRTKSDSSSMVSSNNSKRAVKRKVSFRDKASSMINGSSTVSSVQPESQVGLKAKRLDDAVGGLTFRRKGEGRAKRAAKKQGSSVKEARKKLPRDVCMTDSELGPSPSEVAAEVLAKRRNKSDDVESSVLGGAAWSVAESVEGLQSKLDRWRAELPMTMDAASDVPSNAPSVDKDEVGRDGSHHRRRRRSDDCRRRRRGDREGEGLFSCFSNICGCECSVTCRNPFKKRDEKCGRRRSRSPGSSTCV
ncbi:hypothetical protein SAY86_013338 [Trapa natans]|uniref:C2 domain-containing protein n=1 Tax=Trapa natans TaxID=22666 RepID=A0AAN7M145_TRANT|nr:hypothetical protein SAY86_013338 [Trapa natans]